MEVRVANVRKEFDRFPALHDVSLDIKSGELIALLGPSGSGKTTLLRLIAGLERPTEGTIFFGDEDASQKTVQERNVGFVFQHYALFRHMTVADNIGFGLKVRHAAVAPADARNPPPRLRTARSRPAFRPRKALSGPAFRRPAPARGAGPRHGDRAARAFARRAVRRARRPGAPRTAPLAARDPRRTGHTTVFVTHDQEEALELADRVVVMSQGRIEQVGTADEVYDTPNSPFVFGFIGEVELAAGQGRGRPGLDRRPSDRPGGAATRGGRGVLYFRPHDVELLDGCGGCIAGTVAASRRVAGTRRVELEIGGERQRVEIELPVDHPAAQKSRVAFRPGRWKLFPAA